MMVRVPPHLDACVKRFPACSHLVRAMAICNGISRLLKPRRARGSHTTRNILIRVCGSRLVRAVGIWLVHAVDIWRAGGLVLAGAYEQLLLPRICRLTRTSLQQLYTVLVKVPGQRNVCTDCELYSY